jgi:hypothetical protein
MGGNSRARAPFSYNEVINSSVELFYCFFGYFILNDV